MSALSPQPEAREKAPQAPLFCYLESDGPDQRTGRTAQRRMELDLHVEVAGRSRKVISISLQRDQARGLTVASITMDGVTHTKTFDAR